MVLTASNIVLFLVKVFVAGFFAFMAGTMLDWHALSFIIAAITGLLGVKSLEFVLSLAGY